MRPATGRTAAALAALTLVATACGGPAEPVTEVADQAACPVSALDGTEERTEIVVWHTQQAQPLATLEALVERYNTSQERVTVRLEAQGASYEELQRKFEAAVPSRDLPALLVFDDTATQTMVDSGVVLPAQACVDAAGYDTAELAEVARRYYTVDGQLWPATANLAGALLYYNRDHFLAAGLDPDDPPTTLAEVRATAQALADAGVVDTPLVHEFSSWKTEFWLTGAGATVVDNDNGRGDATTTAATLDDDETAIELFEWFRDMQDDGLLLAIPRAEGRIDHYLAMADQKASMLIESSSAATSVEAFLAGDLDTSELADGDELVDQGLDIGAGPFPTMEGNGRTQMGGNAWYLTNTGSAEELAAAWDFATFLNTPEAQAELLIGGSYLPYNTEANDRPEVQAFFTGGLSGRWLAIAASSVDEIDPRFPGPLIGPYYDLRKEIESAQDRLMLAGQSPTDALAEAQVRITQALERYAAGA